MNDKQPDRQERSERLSLNGEVAARHRGAGAGVNVLQRVQKAHPGDPKKQLAAFMRDFVIKSGTGRQGARQREVGPSTGQGMRKDFWDEWRGDFDGRVVMQIKHLASWRGFKLDLHRFVAADAPGCRHTHPAKAWRLVIWGGYIEEVEVGRTLELRTCSPLFAGMVQPQLCHRIESLLGKVSYSLWLRWPKSHEVELRGDGWGSKPAAP